MLVHALHRVALQRILFDHIPHLAEATLAQHALLLEVVDADRPAWIVVALALGTGPTSHRSPSPQQAGGEYINVSGGYNLARPHWSTGSGNKNGKRRLPPTNSYQKQQRRQLPVRATRTWLGPRSVQSKGKDGISINDDNSVNVLD